MLPTSRRPGGGDLRPGPLTPLLLPPTASTHTRIYSPEAHPSGNIILWIHDSQNDFPPTSMRTQITGKSAPAGNRPAVKSTPPISPTKGPDAATTPPSRGAPATGEAASPAASPRSWERSQASGAARGRVSLPGIGTDEDSAGASGSASRRAGSATSDAECEDEEGEEVVEEEEGEASAGEALPGDNTLPERPAPARARGPRVRVAWSAGTDKGSEQPRPNSRTGEAADGAAEGVGGNGDDSSDGESAGVCEDAEEVAEKQAHNSEESSNDEGKGESLDEDGARRPSWRLGRRGNEGAAEADGEDAAVRRGVTSSARSRRPLHKASASRPPRNGPCGGGFRDGVTGPSGARHFHEVPLTVEGTEKN